MCLQKGVPESGGRRPGFHVYVARNGRKDGINGWWTPPGGARSKLQFWGREKWLFMGAYLTLHVATVKEIQGNTCGKTVSKNRIWYCRGARELVRGRWSCRWCGRGEKGQIR